VFAWTDALTRTMRHTLRHKDRPNGTGWDYTDTDSEINRGG